MADGEPLYPLTELERDSLRVYAVHLMEEILAELRFQNTLVKNTTDFIGRRFR